MRRLASAALVVAILSACVSNHPPVEPAARASPETVVERAEAATRQLVFPEKVRGYSLTETTSVRARPQDKVYRYSDGSETRVTVFHYERDTTDGMTDPQQLVAREGQLFLESLPTSVQRGYYDSYSTALAHADSLVVDGRLLRGHSASVSTTQRGRPVTELQYVYLVGTRFVKVRASVPVESLEGSDVPQFARDLVALLDRQLHTPRHR